MVNINKHKFFLVQILKDIYSDIELSNYLGFKGGSALMFFYDLPRFSVDFNLIDGEYRGLLEAGIQHLGRVWHNYFNSECTPYQVCARTQDRQKRQRMDMQATFSGAA
jgi:hypothetical protein